VTRRGAVLGIDTSGRTGSVALLSGDVREERFEEGMIHGVAMAPAVKRLLAEAGLAARDLDLITVGRGPGSYTGVRVGVAFAKSLAFSAGVPIVGVSSFDAIAANAPADRVTAVVRNARRGAFYLAVYDPGVVPRIEVDLVPWEDARDRLPGDALVLGDATETHADFLSGDGRELGRKDDGEAWALTIARLGADRRETAPVDDVHGLSPIYLRMSEAEERLREKDGGQEKDSRREKDGE